MSSLHNDPQMQKILLPGTRLHLPPRRRAAVAGRGRGPPRQPPCPSSRLGLLGRGGGLFLPFLHALLARRVVVGCCAHRCAAPSMRCAMLGAAGSECPGGHEAWPRHRCNRSKWLRWNCGRRMPVLSLRAARMWRPKGSAFASAALQLAACKTLAQLSLYAPPGHSGRRRIGAEKAPSWIGPGAQKRATRASKFSPRYLPKEAVFLTLARSQMAMAGLGT